MFLFTALVSSLTTAEDFKTVAPADVGLMPKREMGALRFLQQHPKYDGRGVIVAIFDSGVDPGAEGLQVTSDGKPKILDVIDGVGSGDVDMTSLRKIDDNTVLGLTGRTLKIDPAWANEQGEVRLGWKAGFDFFPGDHIAQLKNTRQDDLNEKQRLIETKLQAEIDAAPANERGKLTAKLKLLRDSVGKVADPGPIFDCLVFRDGKHWRAVIDTDEDSDLTDETPLTNFRAERKHGVFPGDLNFAANIYDDGELLSLVVNSSAHATHVAGMVSAYFPGEPELNGVAPGAQIISVNIGHPKMHSMETCEAIERGLLAVLQHRCDIVNMSYGEPTQWPNNGRMIDLIEHAVEETGLLYIAAVGNEGPALSTVCAPGGTTSACLGVGAYLSPEMAAAQYTVDDLPHGIAYDFSSRGPTFDGDVGVDLIAPGGAVATIPRHRHSRNQQMNGTSMATPSASGAAALLLSAAKAEKIVYSAASLKRALKNSAVSIKDAAAMTEGTGLLQIESAWKHLSKNATSKGELWRYDVSVQSYVRSPTNNRGIYLREATDTDRPRVFGVRITPNLPERFKKREALGDLDLRIQLKTTASWVTCGSQLQMPASGGNFSVRVDPAKLKPGAHFAWVLGFDSQLADDKDADRGPLFRVPVTVIIPETKKEHTTELGPGESKRLFFVPPVGAAWIDVQLTLAETGERTRYSLHLTQAGGESFETRRHNHRLTLEPNVSDSVRTAIDPNRLVEVTLTHHWMQLLRQNVKCEVRFGGVTSNSTMLTLLPDAPTAFEAMATSTVAVSPRARLLTKRTILAPSKSERQPLTSLRDTAPPSSEIPKAKTRLVLHYAFKLTNNTRAKLRFPISDPLLYSSAWTGHVVTLRNVHGEVIFVDDIDPDWHTLKRGDYTATVEVRHAENQVLQRLSKATLHLEQTLPTPINLQVFQGLPQVQAKRPTGSTTARSGEQMRFWVAPPASHVTLDQGEVLLGEVKLADDRTEPHPAMQITYANPMGKGTGSEPAKKSYDARLRAAKIEHLKSLPADHQMEFDSLWNELHEAEKGNLELLQLRLHFLDDTTTLKEQLPEIVAAADQVIASINTKKLARHRGRRTSGKEKTDADRNFAALTDALYRKGRALGYMELNDVLAKHPIENRKAHHKAFEKNFAELGRWVDTKSPEFVLLHIRRERRLGHLETALGLLNQQVARDPSEYWYRKKRRDVLNGLGWHHLAERENATLRRSFPDRW